uniref:Uncharacterized protein n=1 Tax=Timema douglasi TaxID=61478 RepID=A0A7R8VX71_TIMDO|nr:unnamed protein product [Timema douglasi]
MALEVIGVIDKLPEPKRYLRDAENPVKFYSDREFIRRFRFSKDTVVNVIVPLLTGPNQNARSLPVPPLIKVIGVIDKLPEPKRYLRDAENPVKFYSDREFIRRFRFSKDTVVNVIVPLLTGPNQNARSLPVPPLIKVVSNELTGRQAPLGICQVPNHRPGSLKKIPPVLEYVLFTQCERIHVFHNLTFTSTRISCYAPPTCRDPLGECRLTHTRPPTVLARTDLGCDGTGLRPPKSRATTQIENIFQADAEQYNTPLCARTLIIPTERGKLARLRPREWIRWYSTCLACKEVTRSVACLLTLDTMVFKPTSVVTQAKASLSSDLVYWYRGGQGSNLGRVFSPRWFIEILPSSSLPHCCKIRITQTSSKRTATVRIILVAKLENIAFVRAGVSDWHARQT